MRTASSDRDAKQPASGWVRRVTGSTAVTIVATVVAILCCALAAPPARAQTSWNFQLTNGGWLTSGTTRPVTQDIPSTYQWMWTGTTGTIPVTGGTSPHWHVRAVGVQYPVSSAATLLTSPTFSGLVPTTTGSVPAVNARISIAHDFFYTTGTNGKPIATGQLQYQLNGSGTWVGLPLDAFNDGGLVTDPNIIFGFSPFRVDASTFRLVNQADFVAPTYVTPTGTAALPIVSGSAAAFLSSTPSWPGDYYVPSEAYLNGDTGLTVGITSLQLRFVNLNLGGKCEHQDGWNIRFVQVDFAALGPPLPEPGTLALGATGLAGAVAAGAIRRRRRHQRASRPSDRP